MAMMVEPNPAPAADFADEVVVMTPMTEDASVDEGRNCASDSPKRVSNFSRKADRARIKRTRRADSEMPNVLAASAPLLSSK